MAREQAPPEPEYLKVEEVATRLKVKEKTVRDWIARGQLEAYKIGKEWRIRRDHLDQAMEATRVSAQRTSTGGLWDPDTAA
jgi:excisionase family DNA binding protein